MNFREAAGAAVLAAVILAPSDCSHETVHAKVCVQGTKSHANGVDFYKRLADKDCLDGKTGARWRYYSGGTQVPEVGGRAPAGSGSFDQPSGTVVRIPAGGGTANQVADS